MEPIIEVKNLIKTFNSRGKKITAMNDVSFNVFKGEIFGMIGPNGAGLQARAEDEGRQTRKRKAQREARESKV
jgi:ABC-type glutathione transport system ATPase component